MTLFRTFPSGPSLRRAVAVAAVATLPIAAVAVPPASAASTLETVSFTTPGATSWTVPSGACNVTVVAVGGAGGHANGGTVFGTWTGASGGDGAEIRMANYPVLPGDSVSIVVGATAADIDNQTSIGTDAGLAAAGGGGATTVNLADPALRIVAGGGGGGAVLKKLTFPGFWGADGGNGGSGRTYGHPSTDGAGQDAAALGTAAKGGVGGVGGAGGTNAGASMPGGSAGSSGLSGPGGAGVFGVAGSQRSSGGSGSGTDGAGGDGAAAVVAGVGGAGGGGGGGYGGGGGGSGTGGGAAGGSVAPAGAKIYSGSNHSAGPGNAWAHGSVTITYVLGDECGAGSPPPTPQALKHFELRKGALYSGTDPSNMALVANTNRPTLNTLAYRAADSQLYAMGAVSGRAVFNHVFRISQAGVTVDLGTVSGLPARPWMAGDIDRVTGRYFVGHGTDLYSIDLSTMVATKVTLPPGATIGSELVVVASYVYTVANGNLLVVNTTASPQTVQATRLPVLSLRDEVGSMWVNWSNGSLWMKVNRTGRIYSITGVGSSPIATLVSTGPVGAGVDGASQTPAPG